MSKTNKNQNSGNGKAEGPNLESSAPLAVLPAPATDENRNQVDEAARLLAEAASKTNEQALDSKEVRRALSKAAQATSKTILAGVKFTRDARKEGADQQALGDLLSRETVAFAEAAGVNRSEMVAKAKRLCAEAIKEDRAANAWSEWL